jgi:hypothetical protein
LGISANSSCSIVDSITGNSDFAGSTENFCVEGATVVVAGIVVTGTEVFGAATVESVVG